MPDHPAPGLPLHDRAASDVLFRPGPGLPAVTAARFTGAALRLAALLPPGTHVVNLCRDRCRFALVFAAALIRRQVNLLCADGSAAHLRRLADRFGDAYAVSDEDACTAPLRHLRFPELGDPPPADTPPVLPADRLAALVFTSGSTGEPVAHAKRWEQLVARSRAAGARFGLRDATVVGTVPPQHMYGFETTVLLPLHAAASTWCGDSFFPGDIAAALAACPAPRVLVTAPLHIRTMLEAGAAVPPGTRVISATAPLPADLAARAGRRWAAEVHEIFGATEVGSIASRRCGGGGTWTPYPGVEVAIGADGTAVVRAPGAEDTELSDVLEPAADGFRLLGRRSDVVKVGGRRASLAGLTAALLRLPGVVDAAMVAPCDGNGRLSALVVAPGRTADELLAALRREVDPVLLPRPLLCVERLPRNAVGKLSHAGLRDMLPTIP